MSKGKTLRSLVGQRHADDEEEVQMRPKKRSFSQPEIVYGHNLTPFFTSNLQSDSDNDTQEKQLCQDPECPNKRPIVKVCHHPGCMERNGDRPLLLCDQCDKDIHSLPQNNGHLVLDAQGKDFVVASGSSMKHKSQRVSHSDNEIEDDDETDGMYIKKMPYPTSTPVSHFEHTGTERESKLRRKKALKSRRHHTDNEREHDDPQSPSPSVSSDNTSLKFDYSDVPPINSPNHMRELRRNSKVNLNNECITLYFPKPDGTTDKEVICALKNTSLREALIPLLDNHGLDIQQVNVYVESSHTPLPTNCETFLLGGNSLYVKKDKEYDQLSSRAKSLPNITGRLSSASNTPTVSHKPDKPIKIAAMGPKRRAMNLSLDDVTHTNVVPATSPHGTWTSESKRAQRSQSKLSNLFTPLLKDKEKYDQLSETLSAYSLNGLPSMPGLMAIGQTKVDESLFDLEAHWSSLVDNASSLNKRQHDHQEAIWELLQTEVHYIRSIRVIADVFMCVLLNLQQDLLLNEIETEKMFSNILDIINANTNFWMTHCVKIVHDARQSRLPFNPSLFKDGFKKFSEIFKPYTTYCLNQKPCSDYMKAVYQENDLFKSFVVWAEAQPQCNRLKLTDLLVKPMQRLTKYSLLLQAILRKTDDERQRRDLLEMISQVDKCVAMVNTTLRQRHDQERLATIVSKIESYDAVEPPNEECKEIMQELCTPPDLWRPMPHCSPHMTRTLVMQSSLKMKDAQTRVDVECLLFTDLLLICKSNKRLDKYRVIKPPLRVDRIIVHELRDKCSFLLILLNEYKVPVWAVTFHTDVGSTRIWLEYIKKAQDMYTAAKASYKLLPAPNFAATPPKTLAITPTDDKALISKLDRGGMPPRQRSHTLSDSHDPELSLNLTAADVPAAKAEHHDNDNNDENSVVKEESVITSPEHKTIHPSVSSPTLVQQSVITTESDEDTDLSNLNSDVTRATNKENTRRNSRSERRYHTADSIKELEQKDRDPTIYKRLSWNVGSADLHIKRLEAKTMSCDSLRSYHSSSGVSSTGSLHHMFDGEVLSEDASENESLKADTIRSTSSNLTLMDLEDSVIANDDRSFDSPVDVVSDGFVETASDSHNDVDTNASEDLNTALHDIDRMFYDVKTTGESVEKNEQLDCDGANETKLDSGSSSLLTPLEKLNLDSGNHKSRSSSDISSVMHNVSRSEIKDGIASVELPKVKERRHMSYARMQKMKQLLLTADIEASEV